MAKQTVVTIHTWCDFHLIDDDKQIEAYYSEDFTVGRLTRTLACCPEHEDLPVSLKDLHSILEKYGTKPDSELAHGPLRPAARQRAMEDGEMHLCPIEKCARSERPYESRTGLRDHVRKVHDTTLGVLEGRPITTKFPCTEEGCNEVPKSAAGLGSHLRAAHGIIGASKTATSRRAALNQAS
jgi:hypothetical protein